MGFWSQSNGGDNNNVITFSFVLLVLQFDEMAKAKAVPRVTVIGLDTSGLNEDVW